MSDIKSSPQITLITKSGSNPLMSKRIFLDDQGMLKSDGSQCLMVQGTAARTSAPTASELAKIIANCSSSQAIALGTLKDGLPDLVTVTVPRKLKETTGAITRSRTFIDYRSGIPAWCLLDFDTKGMPPHVAAQIEAAGSMWDALQMVAPGLLRAARVSRASTTSGLFRGESGDSGETLPGAGGMHHYILVSDAGDIERALKDLHDRCWLNGLGWHMIGGAGQLLDRSLVDRMVGYGERLCFEGSPTVVPPLQQDTAKRIPEIFEGEAIDSGLVAPRLTEYERHRVNDSKAASAQNMGKAAAEVRTRHDKVMAEGISNKSGMPVVAALRLVTARHRGVLFPAIELDFDHLGTVPIATVLADPDRFVGETLADPMEGASYGRCKAKVMVAENGGLLIHSFAHGRGIYHLRHDARSAKAAIAQAPIGAEIDHAMAILAVTDQEDDELADFVATVSKAAKIGVRVIMARVKKEFAQRDAAKRQATLIAKSDARMVRPRPEFNGELLPIVNFLEEILTADQREEPPMRNASGNLVEVRVREPWALHLLTSDGTNDDADEIETMKAPAEPGLVQLTSTGVEILLEDYVRWLVVKDDYTYYATLPRPFVDALMECSPSTIPIAINTAPLVTMSGNIIDGVGLDRDTGLVHRIDPVLRSCLPAEPPKEQTVKDALNFLLDEWLTDVALDRVGKSVAVMMALTLIERALLTERPAFFITAGQRGGGKTTLVNMITLAVLGRRAAAAGWSESAEERKKALFSYLRQGVAALAWDNIPRGSAISCPHIEAALTAAEISDRVLGVSQVATVPSITVQIFTGNSITPRGDMASRSLMLALNISRPDPENRNFSHPDPLAWTQANRPKILRALYTILVAGALNRAQHQLAKTRFKSWWSLVGWPVEYAASLIGLAVDCTDLFRAGEVGDEEASAASGALSILREIFGDQAFTTKDLVKVMPDQKGAFLDARTEDEKARAETVADALGELVGKRLDRPTAHSLGKLFQKRLVGRPAWINDGQSVATLRKITGHNANFYRVEVADPAKSQDPEHIDPLVAGNPRRNIPLFPDNPQNEGLDGREAGKEGNPGNVVPNVPPEDSSNLTETAEMQPAWRARV